MKNMIKKIISALALSVFVLSVAAVPAMGTEVYNNTTASDITSTPTPTPVKTKKIAPTPSPENLACAVTAVEKRDNAIIAAWDTFSAAAKTALQTRRDALKAAWQLTDKKERRAAIVKAWKNFRDTTKSARTVFNKARRDAWKQYAVDLKACKKQGAPTSDDYGTQGLETNL